MNDAHVYDLLSVIGALLGLIFCLGEIVDATQDINDSQFEDDDPTLTFAAQAGRVDETILFVVHAVIVITRSFVMHWRSSHPVSAEALPAVLTASISTFLVTALLTGISYRHRFNRHKLISMSRRRRERDKARLFASEEAVKAAALKLAAESQRRTEIVKDSLSHVQTAIAEMKTQIDSKVIVDAATAITVAKHAAASHTEQMVVSTETRDLAQNIDKKVPDESHRDGPRRERR